MKALIKEFKTVQREVASNELGAKLKTPEVTAIVTKITELRENSCRTSVWAGTKAHGKRLWRRQVKEKLVDRLHNAAGSVVACLDKIARMEAKWMATYYFIRDGKMDHVETEWDI